ncbi:MAG TPA: hypothetical protein VF235_08725 [Actinomycetota bacterium]
MRRLLTLLVAPLLLTSACGASPTDVAADLCHDIDNLRGTIGFLAEPRVDATVGLVRSAVDKLEPTFVRVDDSELVSLTVRARLRNAQEAYAAVLEPYGDDEPVTTVAMGVAQPARRLLDAVASVEAELACETS